MALKLSEYITSVSSKPQLNALIDKVQSNPDYVDCNLGDSTPSKSLTPETNPKVGNIQELIASVDSVNFSVKVMKKKARGVAYFQDLIDSLDACTKLVPSLLTPAESTSMAKMKSQLASSSGNINLFYAFLAANKSEFFARKYKDSFGNDISLFGKALAMSRCRKLLSAKGFPPIGPAYENKIKLRIYPSYTGQKFRHVMLFKRESTSVPPTIPPRVTPARPTAPRLSTTPKDKAYKFIKTKILPSNIFNHSGKIYTFTEGIASAATATATETFTYNSGTSKKLVIETNGDVITIKYDDSFGAPQTQTFRLPITNIAVFQDALKGMLDGVDTTTTRGGSGSRSGGGAGSATRSGGGSGSGSRSGGGSGSGSGSGGGSGSGSGSGGGSGSGSGSGGAGSPGGTGSTGSPGGGPGAPSGRPSGTLPTGHQTLDVLARSDDNYAPVLKIYESLDASMRDNLSYNSTTEELCYDNASGGKFEIPIRSFYKFVKGADNTLYALDINGNLNKMDGLKLAASHSYDFKTTPKAINAEKVLNRLKFNSALKGNTDLQKYFNLGVFRFVAAGSSDYNIAINDEILKNTFSPEEIKVDCDSSKPTSAFNGFTEDKSDPTKIKLKFT